MAIIRITKKQIEEANKAREAALLEDYGYRQHNDRIQSLLRDSALDRSTTRNKEQHPGPAIDAALPTPARATEPTS